MIETTIKGAGIVSTDIKEGTTKAGNTYANFLLRTDDGNIIRIQFWGQTKESVEALFPTGGVKGERVGFRGTLRGTYDEKPTVSCRLEGIRVSGD